MPEIQYPTNPNTDTAFVVQEDGKKNRALMVAPQDISTLELSNNPNSTKGYVTIDGKKHRVNLVADITGGGGGGDVDYSKVVRKADVIPTASASNAGQIYLYTGATNANFTQNYIYKNVKTATYTSTVTFEVATLSSSTIACSGSDFATFVAEWGSADITTITNGTITYDQSGGLLVFVGKDADSTTVCTFQLYTEDYQDAGFTITGTLQDGDVFAFTCSISEASAAYAWTRVDVQPTPDPLPSQTGQNGKFLTTNGTSASWGTVESLPSQTGQSGKFLTTDGTDASWSDKPLTNTATGTSAIAIIGQASSVGSIGIGLQSSATGNSAVAIGWGATTGAYGALALGGSAKANARGSIQLNGGAGGNVSVNNDANTFKVANANGNYEIMSADGTVPTARLTKVNTTATLAVADWSSSTQTVTVSGVKADSVVFVSPAPASASDYASAGILCTAQAANSLTFSCTTTPSNAITVNVICM